MMYRKINPKQVEDYPKYNPLPKYRIVANVSTIKEDPKE